MVGVILDLCVEFGWNGESELERELDELAGEGVLDGEVELAESEVDVD